MRIVDLSTLIVTSPEGTPPFERTDIAYLPHAGGAAQAQAVLKVPPTVFRHGEGWATEEFTKLGTHNSTQVDLPYAQIERLVNLSELPAFGFKVACFPLKIKGGSAGPTRAVAILP
jgi:hypothetical protein